jgi:hypothetical protein
MLGREESKMNHTPPNEPNRPPFEDPVPDPERENPGLDSLLREWLGNETPPDLTGKIDAIEFAARNPQISESRFTQEELVAAVHRAWEETQAMEARKRQARPRTPAMAEHPSFARGAALVLAASLVGILVTYPMWRWSEVKKPIARRVPSQSFPPLGSGSDALFTPEPTRPLESPTPKDNEKMLAESASPPSPSAAGPEARSGSRSDSNPETIAAMDAPTGTQPPADAAPIPEISIPEISIADSSSPKGSGTQPPALADASSPEQELPEQELPVQDMKGQHVVTVIDLQLQHLWSQRDLVPGKIADLRTIEDRLARVLVGRLPTDAEREWSRKASAGGKTLQAARALARRWIESEEFDRHWANALSDFYLDRSLPIEDQDSLARFRGWLQDSLAQNQPLGTVERALMISDARGQEPPAFWIRRWMDAGKSAPEGGLLAPVGLPVGGAKESWSALETIALQVGRLSRERIVSRDSIAAESISPDNLRGIAAAMVASLGSDTLEMMVSDADGKLSVQAPTLPDGSPIAKGTNPRQAMGTWLESNARAREPVIDFAWAQLFGQPLLPKLGLSTEEGSEERKDLLEFLAIQAQQERVSLKQLVLWITMASPLYFEGANVTEQDVIQRDASTLSDLRRQVRLFAKYDGSTGFTDVPLADARVPEATPDRTGSLAGPVAWEPLLTWARPKPGDTSGVLAQPTPQPSSSSPQGSNTPSPMVWSQGQIRYEWSSLRPYNHVIDASLELADSTMDWEKVIDRAYLAMMSRYPAPKEREQTRALLNLVDGDRRKACSLLLNALQGHL